jgi:hypothetical protein
VGNQRLKNSVTGGRGKGKLPGKLLLARGRLCLRENANQTQRLSKNRNGVRHFCIEIYYSDMNCQRKRFGRFLGGARADFFQRQEGIQAMVFDHGVSPPRSVAFAELGRIEKQ